jgi:hypothetical protein
MKIQHEARRPAKRETGSHLAYCLERVYQFIKEIVTMINTLSEIVAIYDKKAIILSYP